MREIRSYGSVRGVVGDRYPYRDSQSACDRLPQTGKRRIDPVPQSTPPKPEWLR
jgi:hypothetical protein